MTRASTSATGVLVALALALAPRPVLAQPTSSLLVSDQTAKNTAVLGLDATDAPAGQALTTALRAALQKRGYSSPQELSLVELRLTMSCAQDTLSCLSEGGKTIGVETLVYGYLRPAPGGGYILELRMLEVDGASITHEITTEVDVIGLEEDAVAKTADRIVRELLGEASEEPAPTEEVKPTTEPEPKRRPPATRDRSIAPPPQVLWGAYNPRPAWKWGLFGTSTLLLLGSAGAALGLTLAVRENGPVYQELIQAAEDSLEDGKASNDIDPDEGGDLCQRAREMPPQEPGKVTNAAVTRVCNKGDAFAQGATISWILTGAFAATTVLFTVLLFARRNPNLARNRALRFGVAPTRDGFAIGSSFRF